MALMIADLYEAAGHFRRVGEATAAAEGQTQARWQVLSVASGQPMTVPQAARRLGVTRQAVQRVANDLVKAGLLALEPNRDHRTSPLLRLTPAGKDTLGRIAERAEALHGQLAPLLSPEQLDGTVDTLRTLIRALRQVENEHSDA